MKKKEDKIITYEEKYSTEGFLSMEDAEKEENEILASEVRIPDTISYYRDIITANPVLTAKKERDLFIKYQDGDSAAREKIILSNLRLVISIAAKYKPHGFDLNDLIQEGILGLEHAMTKFDVSQGYKFSTYATNWIRKYVSMELNSQKYIISMPQHAETDYKKILKASEALTKKLKREPSIDEIYEKMMGKEKFRKTKIRTLLNTAKVFSMDAEDNDENNLFAPILTHKKDDVELIVSAKNRMTKIKEMANILLASMKLNDAMIIKMYFGFNDAHEVPAWEIAEIWGIPEKKVKSVITDLKSVKERYLKSKDAKEILEEED